MDAKSRANFINSVANGQKIPCPKCNTLNEADSKFCEACGNPLEVKKEAEEMAFAPAKQVEVKAQEEVAKTSSVIVEDYNEKDVFAEGLPEWSIEPPQVVVRRKKK